jgi:glycosyltransferase involved in cell wall biosynthesis
MTISAFTYAHNAMQGGYPIVEAVRAVQPHVSEVVAVDCQSDDGTREILERLGCRVLNGRWRQGAGQTLREAHSHYRECQGDVVIHFEADEVYDPALVEEIVKQVEKGRNSLAVWRVQVEQNFQRIRWYPELVHRVYPTNSGVVKEGHTTNQHDLAMVVPTDCGFLWDVTNCFRDNWRDRVENQAWLWGEEPQYRAVPFHFKLPVEVTDVDAFLDQPHWDWKSTPLALPENLRHLVGMRKYEAKL